ncbi:MAG: aldehyde reductase [Melioribacteraceae bacterium]|nr:aldehyde reductase [Melioribacteraceae bacterium]
MQEINQQKPILITGGTGYIASWIIKYLLEKGLDVRATVRDKSNSEKYKHLIDIAENSTGKLTIFEADLLKMGSFKEAMKDCELVFHTASPFKISGIKNAQQELIEPALDGTRNVLNSAKENQSVKRIVLTASVVSMHGDAADMKETENGIFTDKDWNTTSSETHKPYSYSKVLAEKEAWKIVETQDQFDLVTVHPGFVLGPSLTRRRDSASIDFMISMLNGKYKTGVPDLTLGIVDIRDLANVHIAAAFNPKAEGRYIATAGSANMLELASFLKKKYSAKYKIPKMKLPKIMLYLFGPMQGFSWKQIKLNMGLPLKFDNSKSINELGVSYRPIEETVLDHAEQIIRDGLV